MMTERFQIGAIDFDEDDTEEQKVFNSDLQDLSAASPDVKTEKVANKQVIDLEQWEKKAEVRDRLKLWSWALKRKQAIQMKLVVLGTVRELKTRFRKVLYMYQSWKEDKKFQEMQDLIMNFDQGEDYKPKPKLSTMLHGNDIKKLVAAKEDVDLGTVQEEKDEDLEHSTAKMKPAKLGIDYAQVQSLHLSGDRFKKSTNEALSKIQETGDIEEAELNTGEQRQLDTLNKRAVKSKVISEFLQKKERERYNFECDDEASFEEQQKAALTIEGRWLAYMQKMEGKKLRHELKALPFEVRRSYVNFYDLKRKTKLSKNQTDNLSRRI